MKTHANKPKPAPKAEPANQPDPSLSKLHPRPGKAKFSIKTEDRLEPILPLPGTEAPKPGDKPAGEAQVPTKKVRHFIAEFAVDPNATRYCLCFYDGSGFDPQKNKLGKSDPNTKAIIDFTEDLRKLCLPGGKAVIVGQCYNDKPGEFSDPQWYTVREDSEGNVLLDDVIAAVGIKPPTIGPVNDEVTEELPAETADNPPPNRRGSGGRPQDRNRGPGGGSPQSENEYDVLDEVPGTTIVRDRAGKLNVKVVTHVNPVFNVGGTRGLEDNPFQPPPPQKTEPDNAPDEPQRSWISKNWVGCLVALIAIGLIGWLLWSIWKSRHEKSDNASDVGGPAPIVTPAVAKAATKPSTEVSTATATARSSNATAGTVEVGNVKVSGPYAIGYQKNVYGGVEITVNNNYVNPDGHSIRPPSIGTGGEIINSAIADAAEGAEIAKSFAPPPAEKLIWPQSFQPTREIKIPCDVGEFADSEPGSGKKLDKAIPDAKTLPANGYWKVTTSLGWVVEFGNTDEQLEVVVNDLKVSLKDCSCFGDGMVIEFHPRRPNESVPLNITVRHTK